MLSRDLPTVTFVPGQVLIRAGEPGDTAWLILEGEADIFTDGERGVVLLGRAVPRQIVGEMALIDSGMRTATVIAKTAVTATEIPREVFQKLLDNSAPLARHVLSHLINTIRSARKIETALPRFAGPHIRSSEDDSRILERRVLSAGHVIYRATEPSDAAYLLQAGMVCFERDGKQFAVLGPGRTFGEVALLRSARRNHSAVVGSTGATVEIIRRREFEETLASMPKILQALIRSYLAYLAEQGVWQAP